MRASDPQWMVRIRIRAREVAPEVELQRSKAGGWELGQPGGLALLAEDPSTAGWRQGQG